MTLSQQNYLERILTKSNMSKSHSVATPMVTNTRLHASTNDKHRSFSQKAINYAQAIGLLNYLDVSTRPDIAFAVSQLSQNLKRPNKSHWNAVLHLLRYLSGTRGVRLTLSGADVGTVDIFTDSDFGNCPDTRHSYSGYVVRLGASVIAWRSKKQESVSTSTTEAEYKAAYEGLQEAVWLVALFRSLSHTMKRRPELLVDNRGALILSLNPMYQSRSKHIDVKFHWIRKIVDGGSISISYIPTNKNLADMFTKALPKMKHAWDCHGLSLIN